MSSAVSITLALFLFAVCLLTHPTITVSQPSCESLKLSTNKTFDNCKDLPTLNAVLQWTYDPSTTSLSISFTTPIPEGETIGWVGWALNPTGLGMAGSQAILAHKSNASSPVTVATYDLRSYNDTRKGPIAYDVTSLSTVESNKVYTIFATLASPLKVGESSVNQVWQVGPMNDAGMPAKHASDPDNLSSRMELTLIADDGDPTPSTTTTSSVAVVTPFFLTFVPMLLLFLTSFF